MILWSATVSEWLAHGKRQIPDDLHRPWISIVILRFRISLQMAEPQTTLTYLSYHFSCELSGVSKGTPKQPRANMSWGCGLRPRDMVSRSYYAIGNAKVEGYSALLSSWARHVFASRLLRWSVWLRGEGRYRSQCHGDMPSWPYSEITLWENGHKAVWFSTLRRKSGRVVSSLCWLTPRLCCFTRVWVASAQSGW